jgi:hypothetical protein
MSTWSRDLPPTPDDLVDNDDGAPPSKADYRQVWLAYCRQQLDEANARRLEARNRRHLDNREDP